MKTAFILFMVLHGSIHLLGFLKAFEFAEVKELKMPITKASGMIWLITSILFIITAALYLTDSGLYLGFGVSAVTLSQALIWRDWEDAKYGSIPNLIFGVALFLSI
ncbi:hypothetical protein ACKGJO_14180 [Gracilimonas sp. Q87]|uniref:hypothetical protein n=1 Tax=Gracilimonas sp. Q87 TaxID=3384766 RepID=UPI003983E9AC